MKQINALIDAYTLTMLCAIAGVDKAIVHRWQAGEIAPSDRRRIALDCASELMGVIVSAYDQRTLQSWMAGSGFFGRAPAMVLREIAMGETPEIEVEQILLSLVSAAKRLATT